MGGGNFDLTYIDIQTLFGLSSDSLASPRLRSTTANAAPTVSHRTVLRTLVPIALTSHTHLDQTCGQFLSFLVT
jgi:hypothetical protein